MPDVTDENWLEMASTLVERQREALEFIARVQQQFPKAQRRHSPALTNLWLEASVLDEEVLSLLRAMNLRLLGTQANEDSLRGAEMGSPGVRPNVFYYNCSWLLAWGKEQTLTIDLALDPEEEVYYLRVLGGRSGHEIRTGYPPLNLVALKQALVAVFVSEATVDDVPEAVDREEPSMEQPDVSDLLEGLTSLDAEEEQELP